MLLPYSFELSDFIVLICKLNCWRKNVLRHDVMMQMCILIFWSVWVFQCRQSGYFIQYCDFQVFKSHCGQLLVFQLLTLKNLLSLWRVLPLYPRLHKGRGELVCVCGIRELRILSAFNSELYLVWDNNLCFSFLFYIPKYEKKSLHIEVSFCISDLEGFSFFLSKNVLNGIALCRDTAVIAPSAQWQQTYHVWNSLSCIRHTVIKQAVT